MLPEARLTEAMKQVRIVAEDEDIPREVAKDLYHARRDIEDVHNDIEQWREFVDDAEVIDDS